MKEIKKKTLKLSRGIVRLTVEWFLRRENNRWLGWKWILLKEYVFSMEGKMAAGAFGHAGIVGETATLTVSYFSVFFFGGGGHNTAMQLGCITISCDGVNFFG